MTNGRRQSSGITGALWNTPAWCRKNNSATTASMPHTKPQNMRLKPNSPANSSSAGNAIGASSYRPWLLTMRTHSPSSSVATVSPTACIVRARWFQCIASASDKTITISSPALR